MEKKGRELLYIQLKNKILTEYKNKPYYSPLPGERELCDIHNVSRPTVRKALEILETEGSIVKIPGKGAFYIGDSTLGVNPDSSSGHIAFYNQIRLRGDYTSSRVLTQNYELANKYIANKLGIPEKSKVFHLERLRYINDELWSLCDSYISYDLCPDLIEYDFTNRSLHNTLAKFGHFPTKATRHITAQKANEYEAFHLGLELNAPIYISETYSYDEHGQLVEYAVSRNDIFKMSIDMEMQNGTPARALE